MSNINSREQQLARFSLPSISFYGNGNVKSTNISALNSFASLASLKSDWKTAKSSRTTFTQSSSSTTVKETFLDREKRDSTDSKRSPLCLPIDPEKMEVSQSRSNRSSSPDWETCRFSLPEFKPKKEKQNKEKKRRSISKQEKELQKENRQRSVSPDWNTSRFSLPPHTSKNTPNSAKKKKASPLVNGNSSPLNKRFSSERSDSPDWNISRFSLPTSPVASLKPKQKKVLTRMIVPLAYKFKTKISKNTMYRISQKTLDNLLPKPEIHLFDVIRYGTPPQHKDDFLFGLNLMRSDVLTKIDLLHYKKKLRNTGMNFIRTFQQPKKPRSKQAKRNSDDSKKVEEQTKPLDTIEISDQPEEIVIDDIEVDRTGEVDATDEIDTPIYVNGIDEIETPIRYNGIDDDDDDASDVVIQIDDDDGEEETEKLSEEAIQDFADKFGREIVDETTEKSNVVESNIDSSILSNSLDNNINGHEKNSIKETVKISETNTFYHSVTKKHNNRNSLDSKGKLNSKTSDHKRNSLANIKNLKKNGIPKKKSPNKKKNIIKVKWPIARKSLLDIRNKN